MNGIHSTLFTKSDILYIEDIANSLYKTFSFIAIYFFVSSCPHTSLAVENNDNMSYSLNNI